jgi:transposase
MNVRYRVELSQAERGELTAILSKGKRAARKLKRAQILLAADAGRSDEEIARTVAVSGSTVYRTKRRFVEGNLERALSEDPRPGAERKLTCKQEALLVATACANPPNELDRQISRIQLSDKTSRLHPRHVVPHAYAQCRSYKGAPGVDGQDFADIETYGVERWRVAPAGRWNCWPTPWSSSLGTTACRARRCAGGWPKMVSSPGARICGYVVHSPG